MSYVVKSKFYIECEDSLEGYVLISNDEDKNFEVGEKVEIVGEHESDYPNVKYNKCSKCGFITYASFSYCPWCGEKYKREEKKNYETYMERKKKY